VPLKVRGCAETITGGKGQEDGVVTERDVLSWGGKFVSKGEEEPVLPIGEEKVEGLFPWEKFFSAKEGNFRAAEGNIGVKKETLLSRNGKRKGRKKRPGPPLDRLSREENIQEGTHRGRGNAPALPPGKIKKVRAASLVRGVS